MARNRRPSAKARALSGLDEGEVLIFKERKRTRKAAEGGREAVGFSLQLAARSRWSIIIDSRTLTRALQIELGDWFSSALEQQIDPDKGARLPKPRKSRLKKSGQLGIESGRFKSNWQLGKVTGKVSKARGIVQPFSTGSSGSMRYARKFFLDYMLGKRGYRPRALSARDPKTGRFVKGGEGAQPAGNPRKYEHAPVDFQAVTGLSRAVIDEAVDRFINNSGLKTAGPIQKAPKYLGAGSLQKVKSSSGVITGKRGPI